MSTLTNAIVVFFALIKGVRDWFDPTFSLMSEMMEIFFTDPNDVPLPPEEVHIREFNATPLPDGRRVRVYLEIAPFQKRPSGEVVIRDSSGKPVASASIIETIDPRMEITMHLRSPETTGEYSVSVILFYLDEIEEGENEGEVVLKPDKMVVDEAKINFTISD